jgi:hypothetical protein
MNADVDLSIRIEETARDTIIAIANGVSLSMRISAAHKRNAIAELLILKPDRSRAQIHALIFSGLLFLLLKETIDKTTTVFVDTEYPGYDDIIKNRVITLLRATGLTVHRHQIVFRRVGKESPAHKLAYAVFSGKRTADKVITDEDLLTTFGKK